MKKENVYIDLQGKTKEELTDLYWLLKNNNDEILNDGLDLFIRCYLNLESKDDKFHFYSEVWSCAGSNMINSKTEVTIEQLKEILHPMGTFKKGDTIIITDFGTAIPDGVFSLNRPYKLRKDITEGLKVEKDNNGFENGYSVETTLTMKIELYSNTLEQQLQKAEAEVKRLRYLIEEENKPKVGDWVKSDCNHIMKYYEWMVFSPNWIKITNPQLIKLLENECSTKN